MNATKLRDEAVKVLNGRGRWEQKQRTFFTMRHEGLRRQNKPFPRAADFHLPIVDSAIGKQKPFWFGQAANNEQLVTFVARRPQAAALTTQAAEYMDFKLRHESNYLDKLTVALDFMLLRGRGIVKATTDPFNDHALVFESVDPVYVIMADGADDFEDADWFVHVKHVTVPAYKRDRRYNQDAAILARIRGQDTESSSQSQVEFDKALREGVTHTTDQNKIVLWEHWVKTEGGWTYHTYSPKAPDLEIKPPMGCPYKFDGKPSLPFFSLPAELKDEGWNSPRGVAERSAPFETLGCKLMNDYLDGLSFTSKPLFTSESQIPNAANIRFAPGEIVPGNLKRVEMGAGNLELTNVVNMVKGISEELIQTPDFGVTAQDQQGGSKPRTATENARIAQLQDVGGSFNGEILRRRLVKLYKHVWGLLIQFKGEELTYLAGDEMKTLPVEAMHPGYLLVPGGRSDMWNRQQNYGRAVQRFQMFANDPNINQDNLKRDVIAADDPSKVKTLFVPSQQMATNEAEDEAQEISILTEGFPAQVKPNENHAVRIQTLLQYLDAQHMLGKPVDPLAQQRIQEHLAAHMQFLQKQNPQAAQQLMQQIAAMEQQQQAEAQPAQQGQTELTEPTKLGQ